MCSSCRNRLSQLDFSKDTPHNSTHPYTTFDHSSEPAPGAGNAKLPDPDPDGNQSRIANVYVPLDLICGVAGRISHNNRHPDNKAAYIPGNPPHANFALVQ